MYRTDLAIENIEIQKEKQVKPGEIDGIVVNHSTCNEVDVTAVEIVNSKGEAILGKPMGKYVSLETESIVTIEEERENAISEVLAMELKNFIKFHYYLKVLVVGLGNINVTPDSLGPKVLEQVRITRHLFRIFDCDGDEEQANVSGLAPGVMATTGIETAEQLAKAVELVQPELILVIDALAARNIDRISTTIQINNTGISPGAGMGNLRTSLNKKTLGVPVISLGVPTVIACENLVIDALKTAEIDDETISQSLEALNSDMVVTETDIDIIIERFAKIISKAINITLHPGIYS